MAPDQRLTSARRRHDQKVLREIERKLGPLVGKQWPRERNQFLPRTGCYRPRATSEAARKQMVLGAKRARDDQHRTCGREKISLHVEEIVAGV
jgi:hypothetical protein